MMDKCPVIGRFAPSPTGPLHLGSLVAAVGSYVMARRLGGKWLLRMEDLDAPRTVPGMADDLLRTMESLGLQWDGEVLYQSRRTEVYREAMDRLSKSGFVFPCGCTRAEVVRIASAPHGEDGVIYPGTCRDGLPAGKSARAYRVRVDDAIIEFDDGIVGHYAHHLSASCGDFVVRRANGPFAYHLAVVVDDAESGVNQVVRGSDLLASTPRQIYLQRLLGFSTPSYCHLPLVTGPGGTKLSKRDNVVSLASRGSLQERGGLLLTSALRFLGQSPPVELENSRGDEILAWAVAFFNPDLVPKVPGQLEIHAR